MQNSLKFILQESVLSVFAFELLNSVRHIYIIIIKYWSATDTTIYTIYTFTHTYTKEMSVYQTEVFRRKYLYAVWLYTLHCKMVNTFNTIHIDDIKLKKKKKEKRKKNVGRANHITHFI